jgi:prepilin-type N-terminal cleavage/methylation domain-containing protein
MIIFEKISQLKYIDLLLCCKRTNAQGHRSVEKGFTLIEVIVAVIIMSLAYVAILQSFSLSTRNIAKIEDVRNKFLRYSLDFEQQALASRLDDSEDMDMTEDVFIKGSRYNLLLVSDESESLMTLRLEKL